MDGNRCEGESELDYAHRIREIRDQDLQWQRAEWQPGCIRATLIVAQRLADELKPILTDLVGPTTIEVLENPDVPSGDRVGSKAMIAAESKAGYFVRVNLSVDTDVRSEVTPDNLRYFLRGKFIVKKPQQTRMQATKLDLPLLFSDPKAPTVGTTALSKTIRELAGFTAR